MTIQLGNGNGAFGSPVYYHSGFGFGVDTVAVGDFNADGNLDLAITALYYDDGGSDGSYVGVLLGRGDGTFTDLPDWPWEGRWSAFGGTEFLPDSVVADFNSDGNLDIAAPSYYGYVPTAMGIGDGRFGPLTVFSGVNEGSSIVAADFNADGKVDLAVAGNSSVVVLPGNEAGYFNTAQSYATGSGSLSDLAVADFNADGKLNLITSNSTNGIAGVLLGTGAGAFNLATTAAVGTGPSGVAVGDFNADGKVDAVSANSSSGDISVLLNDGNWANLPPLVTISIGDAIVTEGDTGTVNANFTVTLSTSAAVDVTVQYSTMDITATQVDDYVATSGTLTIPAGQTNGTITVPIKGDLFAESTETLSVNLSNATGALIADTQAIGTIVDDDLPPAITMSDVSRAEGNWFITPFTFTVSLSEAHNQAVSVNYATASGTATSSGSKRDYQAKSGTLHFSAGVTSRTVTVLVYGDKRTETNETFFVNLSLATNADIADGHGIGTILNDDGNSLMAGPSPWGPSVEEMTMPLDHAACLWSRWPVRQQDDILWNANKFLSSNSVRDRGSMTWSQETCELEVAQLTQSDDLTLLSAVNRVPPIYVRATHHIDVVFASIDVRDEAHDRWIL